MTTPATSTKKKRRTGSAPPGFERVSTLAKRVGFAESTVKGWAANKALNFPAPIKLGARVSIYAIAAVDAWMAEHLGVKVGGNAAPAQVVVA